MDSNQGHVSSGVREMAHALHISSSSPELRIAEAIAETIDGMSQDDRVRMLPNHTGQLLNALRQMRELGMPADPESRGLSDAALAEFLSGLQSEHGSE